jgi:hypothetical protein
MNRQSRKARFGAGMFAGKITMLAAGAAALALLGGCSETTTNNPEQGGPYTLTVNSTLTGGDTAGFNSAMFQITPKQAEYDNGTTVTVIFNSQGDGRFVFKGWTGASTSAGDTVKITMNKNQTLTAEIERRYTVTAEIKPDTSCGRVTFRPDTSKFYASGARVLLTATAKDSSSTFTGWEGDTTLPGAGNYQFATTILNEDLKYTAVFHKKYKVIVTIMEGSGTVTLDPNPADGLFEEGTKVRLTAVTDGIFGGWKNADGTPYDDENETIEITIGDKDAEVFVKFF